MKKKHTFFVLFLLGILFSQSIPNDYRMNKALNLLNDHGLAWNFNTVFKPVLWQDIEFNNFKIEKDYHWYFNKNFFFFDDSSNIFLTKNISKSNMSPGFFIEDSFNDSTKINDGLVYSIYNYLYYSFNKNVYSWLYFRITNNSEHLFRYTGKSRKKSRLGFNSGETDMSGIGYFGNIFRFWIGRDRQNWGAMHFDNIAISENSPSYDQVVLDAKVNNFKYRYFYGFLETTDLGNNRYINGRGIEYSNYKNLLIGFHEVVIYSGLNRMFDLAYLNPISTHLEIELNNRDNNFEGTGAQNAIWQLSFDYMPIKGLRLSSNILVDEIAIDFSETDTLTNGNDLGIQNRIAYSTILLGCMTTFHFNHSYVGTYTLRHEKGENNFVSRNETLGTSLGSDMNFFEIGIIIITPWKFRFEISVSEKNNGENNILNNLYLSNSYVHNSSFPSGIVDKNKVLSLSLFYNFNDNISAIFDYNINSFNSNTYDNQLKFSINTYFSTNFIK